MITIPNKKLLIPNRIIRTLTPHRVMMGSAGGIIGGLIPPFVDDPHTKAVDLNGTNESLRNTTDNTFGFGDTWSIGTWFNSDSVTGNRILVLLDPSGSNNSRLVVELTDVSTTQRIRLTLHDSAGAQIKAWTKTGNFSASVNNRLVITWTGNTTLNGYVNGVIITSWTKGTDNTGTMANDARQIYIGQDPGDVAYFAGNLSTVDIWNVALDQNNITAEYNGAGGSGTGYKDDLRIDQGNYNKSGNLVHQWKLGNDGAADANIGVDYIGSGGVNVSDNQVNITTADIVTF